jgi:murein L,D-transpeptidase YcbB/YkuD
MDIYLHDTPANNLFSQTSRAFSHGCIRVEKPVELAHLIFEKATDRPASDYAELRSRSGEQWVTLTKKVPVYILYFTAYAHRDGSVSFHPDIYERDRILDEQVTERLRRAT